MSATAVEPMPPAGARSSAPRREALAAALDVAVLVLGAAAVLPVVVAWLAGGGRPTAGSAVAAALVVLFSRFPLVLDHGAGDIVIGFETCVLVFLVLTAPPAEALSVWAVGTVLANATASKSWRSRVFNIGLTLLGGALFVAIVGLLDPGPSQAGLQLLAVMLGCAVYFAFDLLLTAASLLVEGGRREPEQGRWGTVPLGLACFVSVDTLGYLAALLVAGQPAWTLALLLVPVVTILVAVRSVSDSRLARRRLAGLLEAATHAPDWQDEADVELALVAQAERTLRHSVAELRDHPAEHPAIGAPLVIDGHQKRHLVVARRSSNRRFDELDREALEALTAVGASALARRRLSDEMTYLARHDALTGLHNRPVFLERVAASVASRAVRGIVAVLYLDLDGFKQVNDVLGHAAGDELLVQVARRIAGCLRETDTAARLGGDEFGVLLDDLGSREDAERIADRLVRALEEPFVVEGQRARVRASVGLAFAQGTQEPAETLISAADTAMYAAKAQGKGRVALFMPAMRSNELDRLALESALRDAVEQDEIAVVYQPVVDLRTGSVDGFEALARWHHPVLGEVRPDRFIPAAERLGIVGDLGRQVLERAHAGAREIAREAGRPISLSVNLSALQVHDRTLAPRVATLVRSHPEVRLVLELTEGVMLGDDTAALAGLHRLRATGARLAIDDFGVGYSSVGYLHRLPVDILKIDKLFVSELHDERSRSLVQGVVSMARALGLGVVTEGVEDGASALILRDLGCDHAQGFLFSRPLALHRAVALARRGRIDLAAMMMGSAAVVVPVRRRRVVLPAPEPAAAAATA